MKKETLLWVKQAKEHYKDALYLFKGCRYSSTVFMCHQALEKILKAAVLKFAGKVPAKIHQLEAIAKEAKLKLPEGWDENLAEVTRHFWRVRYPDFRKYTYTNRKSAEPTVKITKEVFKWVLQKLKEN